MRIMLAQRDYMPMNIIEFLNHAENLVLLRQVGSGYIFIHRLILEHFAGMQAAQEVTPQAPAPKIVAAPEPA
jgi:hypothetical protein